MANSADPDQLASSEANWSGSTAVCKGRVYPGSAGQGLNSEQKEILPWLKQWTQKKKKKKKKKNTYILPRLKQWNWN